MFLLRSTSLDAVGHEAILSVFLGHQGVFGSQEGKPHQLEGAHDLVDVLFGEIFAEEDDKEGTLERFCFIHQACQTVYRQRQKAMITKVCCACVGQRYQWCGCVEHDMYVRMHIYHSIPFQLHMHERIVSHTICPPPHTHHKALKHTHKYIRT